jgi:hypothetical protein
MGIAMAAGVVVGLALAVALAGRLAPFLFGVSPTDWISFGVAPILLGVAAVLACAVPARRWQTLIRSRCSKKGSWQ